MLVYTQFLPGIYQVKSNSTGSRCGTISDDYGPAATCRSMDLAAAAGARATSMSRLWAGDAAGGRGPERRCDGTHDYATAGSWPTRQSGARDSELPQAPVDVACARLLVRP